MILDFGLGILDLRYSACRELPFEILRVFDSVERSFLKMDRAQRHHRSKIPPGVGSYDPYFSALRSVLKNSQFNRKRN
jgi:hypothetical protein